MEIAEGQATLHDTTFVHPLTLLKPTLSLFSFFGSRFFFSMVKLVQGWWHTYHTEHKHTHPSTDISRNPHAHTTARTFGQIPQSANGVSLTTGRSAVSVCVLLLLPHQ